MNSEPSAEAAPAGGVPNLPAVIGPRAVAEAGAPHPLHAAISDPAQKAAIVLAALGPAPSAPVLKSLGAKRARRFARALSDLPPTPPEVVSEVLGEFASLVGDDARVSGGAGLVRTFLAEVMSTDELEEAMSDLNDEAPSVWRSLSLLPDEEICAWATQEHPHVAAIALAQLPSEKSARVLEIMDEDRAQILVLRMGASTSAEPAMIGRIANALELEFLPQARMRANGEDPSVRVAGVLNHVAMDLRESILTALEETKPDFARSVRQTMFTFENIATRINPRDVSVITRAVSEAVLLCALKLAGGGSEEVAAFIFANISGRLADRLREELSEMEAPAEAESDEARAALVAAITAARTRGEIKLILPD